ncbi:MAG: transcription elongation factor GreA [Bdellovibrionales bacterium]
MEKHPMTIEGKARLDEELKDLLQVQRPAVIKAIEVARGHGDLSENADYDAAKERQGFIEARIGEIQAKLAVAEVIDPKDIKSDKIVFGATVYLLDLDTDTELTYKLVGVDEADVKLGLISVFSPLGRALIGKKKSDIVEFSSPKGDKEYEVTKFQFK